LGHLFPSRLMTVAFTLSPAAPRPLKTRSRLRLHLGTRELLASVALLDRASLAPGDTALSQFFLAAEAVAVWNQPFIARSESPVVTLGGGHVLDPRAEKLRHPNPNVLKLLADWRSPVEATRAAAALYFKGWRAWEPSEWSSTAGVSDFQPIYQSLQSAGVLREIVLSPTRTLRLHAQRIGELAERVCAALTVLHDRFPLQGTFDRSQFAAGFRYLGDATILDAVLQELAKARKIRLTEQKIALHGRGPQLSSGERQFMAILVESFRTAGVRPPSIEDCRHRATKYQQIIPQLLALAVADGDLIELGQGFFLHRDIECDIRDRLQTALAQASQGMTLSEIRELLGTTRKYAVPICEYLDKIGFTRRSGDLRFLSTTTS
jgi:selenocysteine-specific elongation factor